MEASDIFSKDIETYSFDEESIFDSNRNLLGKIIYHSRWSENIEIVDLNSNRLLLVKEANYFFGSSFKITDSKDDIIGKIDYIMGHKIILKDNFGKALLRANIHSDKITDIKKIP